MSKHAKVPLGRLVATTAVAKLMDDDREFYSCVMQALARHVAGDWGDVCDEDKALNDQALELDNRVLSSYPCPTPDDPTAKIWIITEADRSSTTVLFPEEY